MTLKSGLYDRYKHKLSGLKKMKRKRFSSIMKVFLLFLSTLSLCLSLSCKKPAGELPSGGQQQAEPAEAAVVEANDMEAETPDIPPLPSLEEPTATGEDVNASINTNAARMAPIKLELPRPMFEGTPQDNRVPNIEKPLGKPRPPFLAPAGTKNVALGKPVSSSDKEPIIGELELITDDDKEAIDGSYVELGPFLQNVTIDLEAMHEIYAIVFWHYHKQARVYYDVIVQVADDPDFITNVRTLFNNDIDNSAGLGVGKDMHYVETAEGKLIDARGKRARYVRLYSNGSTSDELNHYIEVAVYGKPVE